MRVIIHLESNKGSFFIPRDCNHLVQSAVYAVLGDGWGTKIHDSPFQTGKRRFPMIVFSDFITTEKPELIEEGRNYRGPTQLIVASPISEVVQVLVAGLLRNGRIRIGAEEIDVVKVDIENSQVNDDEITVKTISPVVVYSTLLRADGRKYTAYFQPGEADFTELVVANLKRKYHALYGELPTQDVKVETLHCGRMRLSRYKGTIIKGWHCRLILKGPPKLLELALNAGIGSKNAQGWGCLAMLPKRSATADTGFSATRCFW